MSWKCCHFAFKFWDSRPYFQRVWNLSVDSWGLRRKEDSEEKTRFLLEIAEVNPYQVALISFLPHLLKSSALPCPHRVAKSGNLASKKARETSGKGVSAHTGNSALIAMHVAVKDQVFFLGRDFCPVIESHLTTRNVSAEHGNLLFGKHEKKNCQVKM